MKVSEVMARDCESVAAEATIEGAAQIMAELDVAVLPVQERDELVGILTERDITVRVVAAGLVPAETKVAEVMSSDVVTCRPDDDIAQAETELQARKIQQLPVVSEQGKLVGLVTRSAIRRAGDRPAEAPVPPRTPAESESR
jgi:CBS domain-containing protein